MAAGHWFEEPLKPHAARIKGTGIPGVLLPQGSSRVNDALRRGKRGEKSSAKPTSIPPSSDLGGSPQVRAPGLANLRRTPALSSTGSVSASFDIVGTR